MLHTIEGFRLIPEPRTPGQEPRLPLGVGGPSSRAPRGKRNHRCHLRSKMLPGAHRTSTTTNTRPPREQRQRSRPGWGRCRRSPTGGARHDRDRGAERGTGSHRPLPARPRRPRRGSAPERRPGSPVPPWRRGEAGGSYPQHGSGSRTPFSAPPASPGRWRDRLRPKARPAPAARRSAPCAAARPGARAAGPDGGGGGSSGRVRGGGSGSPRQRLSPLAAPLLTDSRGARAPHSPAPSGTYQLRPPPPCLPVPRRPAAICPFPGLRLVGSLRLTRHRHYGGLCPASGASEGLPIRPPPLMRGNGTRRALGRCPALGAGGGSPGQGRSVSPAAAAGGTRGRGGECRGPGGVSGASGALPGVCGPAALPGEPGSRGGGSRPGGELAELLSRDYVLSGLPPSLGLVRC